jgi:ferrous iron transport protein B
VALKAPPEREVAAEDRGSGPRPQKLFLVGNPNVGKSVIFNALTGTYAVVSNYPGTTVEVLEGTVIIGGERLTVIDTPGLYSLRPITEEEDVTRQILLREKGLVVHVVDAKNLPRMLPLTLELCLAARPVVLALNLMDEAEKAGVEVDVSALSKSLGIPVVQMVATKGRGLEELRAAILGRAVPPAPPVTFSRRIEEALQCLRPHLPPESWRFWGLRHLEGDRAAREVCPVPDEALAGAERALGPAMRRGLAVETAKAFRGASKSLLSSCYSERAARGRSLQRSLDKILLNPWTGFPLLVLVLFAGLYEFVGVFAGGFLVGLLENSLFGRWISPFLEELFAAIVPWEWLRGLFVGDYGMLTLGLRYATAIILPVVGAFFLAFSVLEDTGYLPRLAMMLDRLFKRIGLNGRAVIPLVLGFGCDTMATMTTRILETKRERVIATFLLALSIPCSAQIGVLLGLLSGHPAALLLWGFILAAVFIAAGTFMARFVPGEKPSFFMELPPLRLPSPKNVLSKTVSRMGWYFLEIFPLFILASVLIWAGQLTGLFPLAVKLLKPAVSLMGLPPQTAPAVLFGFFRRDYGAAGLYDLQRTGVLTGNQLLVAAVTLTLFLPCIAQFLVMRKERGWKMTLGMSGAIVAVAFAVGWTLNQLLDLAGLVL